jgi:shikimate dehydrogenase
MAEARAETVGIWNRTPARAIRLAGDIEAAGAEVAVVEGTSPVTALPGWDCVINCTSAGMDGGGAEGQSPCDVTRASPGTLFVDSVYAPERTPLLEAAQAAGFRTLGGLPMLIYQGALAFELWTGIPAPVEVMFDAARAALAERARQEAAR